MKLKEHLINSCNDNINESIILATMLTASILAYAFTPMVTAGFNAVGEKYKNQKEKPTTVWDFLMSRSKKDDENDSKKDDKNDSKKDDKNDSKKDDNTSLIFNKLIMMAQESNKKEKDKNAKAKNDNMIKLLTACSFDKDGNEIPFEERMSKMKDMVPEDQFEQLQKDMEDTYNKIKDSDEFKEDLKKASKAIKESDYDSFIENSKKEAKEIAERLEKEKKEIEAKEKELEEIKKELDGDEDNKELKEKLSNTEKDLNKLQQSSIVGSAAGAGKSEEETDEDGNVVKDEEITDPDTGKKIKVKTYTGPRGGKFYYPEGKPKTEEHRVYIQESLIEYLKRSLL